MVSELSKTIVRAIGLFVIIALTGACELVGIGDSKTDVLFITQSAPQSAVMQALYQGKVVVEDDCYRLASEPDAHTVVWPHGFRLAGPANDLVVNDRGKVVGRIGSEFRLGGGEVSTLWEQGPVAEPVRSIALTRCPGRYWLVGEIG